MNIIIRLGITEDCLAILKLIKEGQLATYPNEALGITREDALKKDFDGPERLAKWKQRMNDPKNYRTWIAESDGKVVGCCTAKKMQSELTSVYITSAFQGRGIGTYLIHEALKWLGGARDVTLSVVAHNSGAIKLYEKHGFIFSHTSETQSVPGKVIPLMVLKKPKIS